MTNARSASIICVLSQCGYRGAEVASGIRATRHFVGFPEPTGRDRIRRNRVRTHSATCRCWALTGVCHKLDQGASTDDDTGQFLIACAETAAASWPEKDRGVWEVRGDPQHFVYSKVMCWVALDRELFRTFPKAFSHLGLVNAASRSRKAERPARS